MQFELTKKDKEKLDKNVAKKRFEDKEFIYDCYTKTMPNNLAFQITGTVHVQSFIEMNKHNYPN